MWFLSALQKQARRSRFWGVIGSVIFLMVGFFSHIFEEFGLWIALSAAIVYVAARDFFTPSGPIYEKIRPIFKASDASLPIEATTTEKTGHVFAFKSFRSLDEFLENSFQEICAYFHQLPPSIISLFVRTEGKASRYPISLSYILEPISYQSLEIMERPVVSLPQKKIYFQEVASYIFLSEIKQSTSVETLEIKGSDTERSYLKLFIHFKNLQRLLKNKSASVPFLYRLDSDILICQKTRQTFLDFVTHPLFPKHRFIFLAPKDLFTTFGDFFLHISQLGLFCIVEISDFSTPTLPDFVTLLYMDQQRAIQQLDGIAKRLANHLVQTFVEQTHKIVLANVGDEKFLEDILPTQFDFGCGPRFGNFRIIKE